MDFGTFEDDWARTWKWHTTAGLRRLSKKNGTSRNTSMFQVKSENVHAVHATSRRELCESERSEIDVLLKKLINF